jgi:predicted nucleic acid-binding protein
VPNANFLLSLAVEGAATYLLAGDNDLLVLHPFGEVEILTLAGYLSEK